MTTRKDFLVASTVAAALTPIASSAAPSASDAIGAFVFDKARFAAWTTQAVAHRHAFAATESSDGLAFSAMTNVLNAYQEGLGEATPSVTSAGVFYHGNAILMGFNDRVWNEMLLPLAAKWPRLREFKQYAPGSGNPWLHKPKLGTHDASIDTLGKRGAVFFICNNATSGTAEGLATELHITPAAAYAKLTSNLVPRAMLVPAGVWAIHALQEARFTYEQVTL